MITEFYQQSLSLTENCSGNEFAYSGRNNYSFLNDSLFTSRLFMNTNLITTNARVISIEYNARNISAIL